MTLGEAIAQAVYEHDRYLVCTTRHLRVLNQWPIYWWGEGLVDAFDCPWRA